MPASRSAVTLSPSSQGQTVQCQGYPCAGSPQREGDGGRHAGEVQAASTASQRCSRFRLPRGPVDAGQPDGQAVAQPEDGVVGARMVGETAAMGRSAHCGNWSRQQPPHQRYADLDLVLVHLSRPSTPLPNAHEQ